MVDQNKEKIACDGRELEDLREASDDSALAAGRHGRCGERVLQFARPVEGTFKGAQLAEGGVRFQAGGGGGHVRKRLGVSRGYGRECHLKFTISSYVRTLERERLQSRASCG